MRKLGFHFCATDAKINQLKVFHAPEKNNTKYDEGRRRYGRSRIASNMKTKLLTRSISFFLCLAMMLALVPAIGATRAQAATMSQNNIVARAD